MLIAELITLIGKLLSWMAEHWAQLLLFVGFVVILRRLYAICDQLSYVNTMLGHTLDWINETNQILGRLEHVIREINAPQVTGIEDGIDETNRILSKIERKILEPPTPPYPTPTGHEL